MQKIGLIRGRVLSVRGREFTLARGAKLFRSDDEGQTWYHWHTLPVGVVHRVAMAVPILARLFRLGVHHLVYVDNKAVVVANKESFLIDSGNVVSMGPLKGSRPMILCGSQNECFYGEYRSNPERSEVAIYRLDFHNATWRTAWKFNGVRHVHGVFYDDYTNSFWVTTGDSDEESAIWRTDDQFSSLKRVVGGNQQFRAVQLLFTEDYVYFGSDAPNELNHIYRMKKNGSTVEKLASVGGSVFYGFKTSRYLFFSTAVEPSDVNSSRNSQVWFSKTGGTWKIACSFKKDSLSMKYFQYGQVFFPTLYGNDIEKLLCSPFATKGHGKTFVMDECSE